MQISELTFDDASPVDSYGPGFFRVAGDVLHGNVLLTKSTARLWSGLDDIAPLLALSGEIDVIILGLGAEMTWRPQDVIAGLEAANIGVEIMASPTACRAYNMLLAEERRVALAALAI